MTTNCAYRVVASDRLFSHNRIQFEPLQEEVPLGFAPLLSADISQGLLDEGIALTSNADAVLSGSILQGRALGTPVPAVTGAVPSYQLGVVVNVRLQNTDGEILWEATFQHQEDFLTPTEAIQTRTFSLQIEANRRRAWHRASKQLAQDIVERLILAGSIAQ